MEEVGWPGCRNQNILRYPGYFVPTSMCPDIFTGCMKSYMVKYRMIKYEVFSISRRFDRLDVSSFARFWKKDEVKYKDE